MGENVDPGRRALTVTARMLRAVPAPHPPAEIVRYGPRVSVSASARQEGLTSLRGVD